ncbi:MAG: DpnD/PcfM family protein [Clostridia bacterium]
MNRYKIEFKQTFKKEITVFADDENEAMDIVEKAYLKTDLLDNSYRDLAELKLKLLKKTMKRLNKT